ncbi:MAG: hypothetical protein Q4E45_08620 [Eubacteriales bacterium]|nr:hypothetical protein [Eubacteriales bacterium]
MKRQNLTSFYLEALLLVVIFVSMILVLTGVFGAARTQSTQAKRLSQAVTLASNAAEAVSAADSEESLLRLLNENDNALRITDDAGVTAFYDVDGSPDPRGAFRVDVSWLPEGTMTGTLVSSVIQVRFDGDEPVYRLETLSFKKEATP